MPRSSVGSCYVVAVGSVCDGHGQLAFGVVAVSDMDESPVVDHGHGVQVDRDVAGVVGLVAELGQCLAQPPGAAFVADGAEGGGVALGFGEDVAAEPRACAPSGEALAG
jgi:hypothetical protein